MKYIVSFKPDYYDIEIDETFAAREQAEQYAAKEKEKYGEDAYIVWKIDVDDTDCEMADYCDNDETVIVTVNATINDVAGVYRFDVQLTDGEHRSDLGCWLTTDGGGDGEFSDAEEVVYAAVDIVALAEDYADSCVEEINTHEQMAERGDYVTLLVKNDRVDLVTRNDDYINQQTSSYQHRFSGVIESFGDVEDAEKWLEENSV